jgi:hypothetical protein
MNIARHANRQTSRTFDLLKTYWIWPMLYNLDPNRHKFLTTFLTLMDLGSFIDNRALVDYVNRTRLVQQKYPPLRFIRDKTGAYVTTELIRFLHGREHQSINAGAMFIQYVSAITSLCPNLKEHLPSPRHILSNEIPIELTVLCRLLEVVAGSFIMASAFQKKGSLHGVTLPRSWILENVQKLYRVLNKNAHPHAAWEMTKPFQDLLERVYSGTDNGELSIGKPI